MALFGDSTKSFDFMKFFLIFLLWVIGSWIIIKQMDKFDREGSFMFNEKNYRITGVTKEDIEENGEENADDSNKKRKSLKLEIEQNNDR